MFYLLFLLLEARRFPELVRARFQPVQADRVLRIVDSINRAMDSYLRAKVLSSLVTALPVVVILWTFGVPFPGMWGILAFVGNFIPYVGSLVAFVLPVLLAFLELEPPWRPVAVLSLLILVHVVTNNFVEPRLTAHAVGLNPLMVLVATRVLGPVLGPCRDGAGRAIDGDAQDRVRKHRAHSPPGPDHGRAMIRSTCIPSAPCDQVARASASVTSASRKIGAASLPR